MNYTRRAIGLLSAQYRSVLKKCFLINCGLLAFTGAVNAVTIVDSYDDLLTALDAASDADVVLDTNGAGISLNNAPGIVIGKDQSVQIQNVGTKGESYWTEADGSVRQISNNGELKIDSLYYENNVISVPFSRTGSLICNEGHISSIINSSISNNQTSTTDTTLWGGIINNNNASRIDLIQNVVFDGNIMTAGRNAPHGGVISNAYDDTLNGAVIDVIDNVVFSNNVITGPANQIGGAHGGAIDNQVNGFINKITNSVFKNNYVYRTGTEELSGNYHASAAALDNYNYIGEISNTLFEDNHTSTESISAGSSGGAIMSLYLNDEESLGYIGKMENVTFIHNYIETVGRASGGAIVGGTAVGATGSGNSYIGYITGSFSDNYAYSKAEYANGGAIENGGEIGYITADFTRNYAKGTQNKSEYIGAMGGAVYNRGGSIGDITGNFSENHVYNNGTSSAYGGAIYSREAEIDNITGDFSNNYAYSSSNSAGGAIVNFSAGIKGITGNFKGNYAKGTLNNSGYIGAMGGAVYNYEGTIVDITGNFVDNYVYNTGVSSAYGGAIYNRVAEIADITGDFSDNYAYSTEGSARGGVILNYSATINNISGNFNGNHATNPVTDNVFGGAIYNYQAQINDISGNFSGNYVQSSAEGDTQGGAISQLGGMVEEAYVWSKINSLNGNFTNNYALSNGRASGGAISNNNIAEITKGIFGDFEGNYAKSTGTEALARGGAIISFGKIGKVQGKFKNNYAESSGTGVTGGALALMSGTFPSDTDEIVADFIGNYATATGSGYAYGGAIYIDSGTVGNITGDFIGNYAKSESGTAQGGAIYNSGTIGFGGINSFSDNYVEQRGTKTPNDIYNSGTITLKENAVVNINDGINGSSGKINMNSGSVLNLNGYFSDNTITADNANVFVMENGRFGNNATLNINAGSLLAIEPTQITVNKATFAAGSTLSLKVTDLEQSGVLYAKNLSIAPDETATMKISMAQGILNNVETAEVQILKADNAFENTFKDEFADNNMYDFAKKDGAAGWYNITKTKTADEVSREAGGTQTEARAAAAWVDGDEFAEGSTAKKVADSLADLAQNDKAEFNNALSVVAPQDAPVVETGVTDASDKLLLTVEDHLTGNDIGGLSSGDALQDVSIWAKGYYGKSKLSDSGNIKGFDSKNKGVIAGVDKKLNNAVKLGFGFQYNDNDIDAFRRDVEVDTVTGFIYGEYRPSNWYVNGIASYGRSDYKEKKYALGFKIDDKYNADTYSLQAITGYDFKYVSPEIGARYYHIKRYGYDDSIGQKVSRSNMDLLRGVLGLRASHEFGMFKPEVYVGMTYDFVNDKDNAIVSLPNGSSYAVDSKRLKRFGTEVNTNLTANLTDHASVTLGYEGKFRKDYKDNTGLIIAKYKF